MGQGLSVYVELITMKLPKRANSLFLKTSLTLAFGLFCFSLISILLIFNFILSPVASRAADDFGGLMHILSKSWSLMHETERPAFQEHLLQQHSLLVTDEQPLSIPLEKYYPYLFRLENALHHHSGHKIQIHQSITDAEYFWLSIPHEQQTVHIGFEHSRLGPHPVKAVIGILIAALCLIIITTVLLVRRITKPITTLSYAVNLLGSGDLSTRLPETGAEELVQLAHQFNKMAEEITQLLNNRNLLFGGISHDLRTPFTRMKIALELIEGKENTSYIQGIKKDLDEMTNLIQHTLELIKGMDKHQGALVSVHETIDMIAADYLKQGHKLVVENHSNIESVIEVHALRRVLCNLLDNAFRYGGKAAVKLHCSNTAEFISIKVIDQGAGIPLNMLQSIFQPFFRIDHSRSKTTGGSGLGLAIAKQLCDIQGWTIEIKSPKQAGVEACLTLPISIEKA